MAVSFRAARSRADSSSTGRAPARAGDGPDTEASIDHVAALAADSTRSEQPDQDSFPAWSLFHAYPIAVIAALGLAALSASVGIFFFDTDHLLGLEQGRRGPYELFTSSLFETVPGYRPLTYSTIWFQHELFGLTTKPYFLFNLGTWLACGLSLYLLAQRLTACRLAATAVALTMLLDPRAENYVRWITERSDAFVVLFGTLALLVAVIRPSGRRRTWFAAAFGLLLAAALSKEYGLVFSAAVLVAALVPRPAARWVAGAALSAVGAYAAIRLLLAGGAAPSYCEDVAFFDSIRTTPGGFEGHMTCYADLSFGTRIAQHLYNIGAGFLGTFIPTVFTDSGILKPAAGLQIDRAGLVFDVSVATLAVVAWIKRPVVAAPAGALVLANSLLSFMVYRDRNLLAGRVGLFLAAGIGLALIFAWLGASHRRRIALAGLIVLLGVTTGLRGGRLHDRLVDYRELSREANPCETIKHRPIDPSVELVREVERHYGRVPRC